MRPQPFARMLLTVAIFVESLTLGSILLGQVAEVPASARGLVSQRVGLKLIHPDQNDPVYSIQFSPDDTKILANTYPKNTIQIWDTNTGLPLVTIETPDEVKGDLKLAVPSADFSKIYTWLQTRGHRETLRVGGVPAYTAVYPESRIQVWQASDGKLIDEMASSPPGQVRYLGHTPDKNFLCSYVAKSGTWVGHHPSVCRYFEFTTGEWKDFPASFRWPVFSQDSTLVAGFEVTSDPSYNETILVTLFPSLTELIKLKLPDGIHSGTSLMFDASNRFLVAEYRTYAQRNEWKNWTVSFTCFDVETGTKLGEIRLPVDNNLPFRATRLINNDTLALAISNANPKKLVALIVPDMKVKWETEIGDFDFLREPVVAPNDRFIAVICTPKSDYDPYGVADPKWDLLPTPQMKVYECDTGKLLETLDLPVAANGLVFSNDGKKAAFGAVGSVYFVDMADLLSD